MANKIPRQISSKPNTEMNLKFYRQKTLIECSILEFQISDKTITKSNIK